MPIRVGSPHDLGDDDESGIALELIFRHEAVKAAAAADMSKLESGTS
jgi:hypothetical protein